MAWKQLVQPNLEIIETAGLCLQFARRVFGAPKVEDSAWEAWERAKHKHADRNFPAGVSVPLFFDWTGNIKWSDGVWRKARYGHAAVLHTDGKIYSSPLTGRGRAWFATVDDLTRAFGGGMTFVGWTEDISNVRVVEYKEANTMNREAVKWIFMLGRNTEPDKNEYDYWTGKKPEELANAIYHSEWNHNFRKGALDYPKVVKENEELKKKTEGEATQRLTALSKALRDVIDVK